MSESVVKTQATSYRNHLKEPAVGRGAGKRMGTPDAAIANLLLYKTLNRMEYFRTRCLEMEEKYGSDVRGMKKKIENGESGMMMGRDELIRWEEFSNSFREWKKKYEDLNAYL